jgi:hypothetical protein
MTTLSVVPARLEYACGRAALVSLPRVKGESPRQRNERVNYEKAAAGQRSCDLCAPSMQPTGGANDLGGVGVVASAQAVTRAMIKGPHVAALERGVNDARLRDDQQEEAMTTTTIEPSTRPDQAPATPAPTRPKSVFPVRKLSEEQEREVTRLYAETATPLGEIGRRFGIGHTSVARIAQWYGAALRSPSISRAMASGRQGSAASAETGRAIEPETKPTQPEPAAQPMGPTVGPSARGPKSAGGRRTAPVVHRPRAEAPVASATPVTTASRRSRTAGVASSSEVRRFVVTFAAEQVLEAESALDALQQAQAGGATDVISIIRVS